MRALSARQLRDSHERAAGYARMCASVDLVNRQERAIFFSITDAKGALHTPDEIIANQK